MTYRVPTLKDLPQVAQLVAQELSHNIICFQGEMGAGKTTFIKALVKELGRNDDVTSPTFALVNEYVTQDYKKIFHFDFYRIEDEEEALDIGLEDYLDSGNICLIEWPNKITNFVPDNHQTISIEILEDGSRQITVNK